MKKWMNSWGFLLAVMVLWFSFTLSSCNNTNGNLIPLSSILDEQDPDPNTLAFLTCIQSFPDVNQTSVTFTPANSSFIPIWLFTATNARVLNSNNRLPSIIVTPFNAQQVQIALYCTKQQGYEIRIRSGGHDLEGISYTAQAPFVIIDFYNMRSIDIDVENQTAWAGPGTVHGELYYAISQKTDTLAFPGGLWPTVALGGLIGNGGGYGNLLRKYGLAADNVLDAQFMDVNGNILDRKSMGEDLFWAIRGGGASSFGIVLAWKLRLVVVPEKITLFTVAKTLEENATKIFHKFQYVAPFINRDLIIIVDITAVNTTTNPPQKTTQVRFQGVYLGTTDTLIPLLDAKFPELGVTREMCNEVKYVEAYLPAAGYDINLPISIIANRSAFPKQSAKGKSDYARRPIPIKGLEKIFAKISEDDGSGRVVISPFGGRMADISETAIPYPHRAGVLYQIFEASFLNDSNSTTTTARRLRWLNELHDVFKPYVSKNPREAYSNYIDLDLGVGNSTYQEASEWGESYWRRHNFKRLIRIKAKVDPQNFFRHPQSIPVFSRSLSLSDI